MLEILLEDSRMSSMVNEAVHALTQKPRTATTLERVRLFDYADAHIGVGQPQPIKYGLALKYVLSNISLPINEGDLLLGRIAEDVPDEAGEAYFQGVCKRFGGRSVPKWVYDSGHTSFYWRDAVELGLSGLLKRAEEEMLRRKAEGANQETLDFLQGAIYVYEALQTYLLRYAQAARLLGLTEAVEACRHAALRKPENFHEALQMLWAIMLVYCSLLAENPTLTYGRMDVLLNSLYEHDIKNGELTREDAGRLILDFYCKNNLIMGRGEHQMSAEDGDLITGWKRNLNYDAPEYMLLGGTLANGESACTDLTLLLAECIVPSFKNPVIVVRYGKDMMKTAPELWHTLTEKMLASASMMVYNEENTATAYENAGADIEDARNFEFYGCNWPCLAGMDVTGTGWLHAWGRRFSKEDWAYITSPEPFDNLPAAFLDALNELAALPEAPGSIDTVYDALGRRFESILRFRMDRTIKAREMLLAEAPGALQFQDCFFRDPISKAASAFCGGSKYYPMAYTIGGFATLADSLTAIDEIVFQNKSVSLAKLHESLTHDFAGYDDILLLCRKAKKYGNDDPAADGHASKLLKMLTDTAYKVFHQTEPTEGPRIILRLSVETDTRHIEIGHRTGATPDGRLAGTPVSQNWQPSPGVSLQGLTARLNSLVKLPAGRIMSGAQNITVQRSFFKGEQGIRMLAAILGTYFDRGGMQAQVSATSVQDLYDAQAHPDAHRDLMVRVTGYSAVFVDMNKTGQDDIIARDAVC